MVEKEGSGVSPSPEVSVSPRPPASQRRWRITVLISGSGSNLGAIIAALPHQLSHCSIVHVLSSRSTAYGLTRAAQHNPPIPSSHFSLATFKKQTGLGRDEYDLKLAAKIKETKPDLVVLAGWMLILSEGFLKALVRDWKEEDVLNWDEEHSDSSASTSTSTSSTSTSTSTTTPSLTTAITEETNSGKKLSSCYSAGKKPPSNSPRIPIINLHPALPGTFPGAHAIKDAWDAFNVPPSPPSPPRAEDPPSLDRLVLEDGNCTGNHAATVPTTARRVRPRITKTGIMIHKVIPLLDAGSPIIVKELDMIKDESLEGLEERIHTIEHEAIVEAVIEVTRRLKTGEWWDEEDS